MKARGVVRALRDYGALLARQRGSHQVWRSPCGTCVTTVPDHGPKDLALGTVLAIERDMAPRFGKG